MADEIGRKAVALEAKLARLLSLISLAHSCQPSLSDNALNRLSLLATRDEQRRLLGFAR